MRNAASTKDGDATNNNARSPVNRIRMRAVANAHAVNTKTFAVR